MRLLLILPLFLTGCVVMKGERVLPDGSILKIHNARFFTVSEGVKVVTEDQNGFKFSLEFQKSNPDAQAMSAIAEGAARGTAQGLKGTPSN